MNELWKELGKLVTDTIKNGRSAHIAVIGLLVCTLVSPGVLTLLMFNPHVFWHGDLGRIVLFCVAPASASVVALSALVYVTAAMELRSEKTALMSWFAGAGLAAFLWHGALALCLIGHETISTMRGFFRLLVVFHILCGGGFLMGAVRESRKRKQDKSRQAKPRGDKLTEGEVASVEATPQAPVI